MVAHQVLGHEPLVAILAAADVDQVVGARVEGLAGAGRGVLEADPAPLAAPPQEDDVAAVGVDVHLVRVEGEEAKGRAHPSPQRTTVDPT